MCFLIYSTCEGVAIILYARHGPALTEAERGAHEGLARQVQTILREARVCFSSVSCSELHECCHRPIALTDKPLNAVGRVIPAVGALGWGGVFTSSGKSRGHLTSVGEGPSVLSWIA